MLLVNHKNIKPITCKISRGLHNDFYFYIFYEFAVCFGEFRHAYGEEHEKGKKIFKAAEKVSNQRYEKPSWDLNASESSHAPLEEDHYLSTTVSAKLQ